MMAQKVTVIEDKIVTNLSDGRFYFPVLSLDGSRLFFSSANYKGLWSKNLSSGKIERISNQLGAGYDIAFDRSNNLIYRENRFVNGKVFSSLKSIDPVSKKAIVIEKDVRDLKVNKSFDGQAQSYFKDSQIYSIGTQALSKNNSGDVIAYNENSQIVILENNQKRVIEPMGKGFYLWISLSPNKSKLLFTFAGRGTFVSDLNGKILNVVGYANYPSWSSDGNWVLFMKDIDDGEKLLTSEIYIANLKTGNYFNLTSEQKEIAVNPKWGKSNSEVYYNTDGGQIRKINLKIE